MTRKLFVSIISLLFIIMMLTACVGQTPAEASAMDTLRVGLAAFPGNLNPQAGLGIVNIKIFYNIFDTLLTMDKNGNIAGLLAERWKWLDDRTLEVTLREGVTFHNGAPCTSLDVAFTFENILNGSADGTLAVLYDTLESVEIKDELTVVFHLKVADVAFEQRLGSIWGASIVPKDYYESVGNEGFQTAPIGTGPFMLTSYSPERYILKAYDGFWGDVPNVGTVEFILYPEASTRVIALITGEVDIINDIPKDLIPVIEREQNLRVVGTDVKNIHIYVFNTLDKDSIMSNEKFRQALTIGMNRQLLVDTLFYDYALVPNGHQFVSYGDAYVPGYPGILFDMEIARRLVEESGYDGVEEIVLENPSGYYVNGNQAAEAIVDMWRTIGVNARVEFVDSFRWDFPHIRPWSSASRFDSPLGAIWLLFGPGSAPAANTWTPTQEFLDAGHTLMTSRDTRERNEAARILMEVFDTYCPGTYLYQVEDVYGIRGDLEWDLHYARNQVTPFRADDFSLAR